MVSLRRPAALAGSAALCVAALATASAAAGAEIGPSSERFDATGAAQNYVVPPDVTAVYVEACGAAGLDLAVGINGFGDGGHGARVSSVVRVTPGEQLQVLVGGTGPDPSAGGFNGGGDWGGGGATDVRQGGSGLADRVLVAGGGGSAGGNHFAGIGYDGGDGGLVGGDGTGGGGFGATQSAGGAGGRGEGSAAVPGFPGTLGLGGAGHPSTVPGAGGGGGLYGGGGGGGGFVDPLAWTGGGGGGSSRADTVVEGACGEDGWLTIAPAGPGPTIAPGAASVTEGDAGSMTVSVPVTLSAPAIGLASVDWTTLGRSDVLGIATSDVDFTAASGTLELAPGETTATIEVEVLGDLADEPPFIQGEWGVVVLSGASPNIRFGTGLFSRLGIFVIIDDDAPA